MIRFKTTIIIAASIAIVASYRNDDLKKFMRPEQQRCWKEVVTDLRSPLTNVGKCFYPSTMTVPPAMVPDVFTDSNSMLPDRLFDPIDYAYYVLGIVGSEYYTTTMYKVSSYPNMPMVKSRGLDLGKAKEILDAGVDAAMRGKYLQFCGIKSSLQPILSCLGNAMASLTRYYEYYCPMSHYQDIQLGIELSKINWAMYTDFCDDLFVCSSTPVKDCIGEMNTEYPYGRPDNFMYSTCMITANFESKFVPCIRKRTEHCPGHLRGAYSKMVYQMSKSMTIFSPGHTVVGSLCRLIQQQCQRHQDWLRMGDVADKCFKPTYDLNHQMGGDALMNMTMRMRYYSMKDSSSARMLCQEIRGIQSCIWRELSDVLPCYHHYETLVGEMLNKLFVVCDALHLDMSHTTESSDRAMTKEPADTMMSTTEMTPENRAEETNPLTIGYTDPLEPFTFPFTTMQDFGTTVPWWRLGSPFTELPYWSTDLPVREAPRTVAPAATIRQTPATARRTPATVRQAPITVRQTTRLEEQEQASAGDLGVLLVPCLAYFSMALNFLI